jgi:hypothetical protein
LSLQSGNDHHLEECDFSATASARRKVGVNSRNSVPTFSHRYPFVRRYRRFGPLPGNFIVEPHRILTKCNCVGEAPECRIFAVTDRGRNRPGCANLSFTLQTETARAIGGTNARVIPGSARGPCLQWRAFLSEGTPGWAANSMEGQINGESPELSPSYGYLPFGL